MSAAMERWSAFMCGVASESHAEWLYRRGIAVWQNDVLDRLRSLGHHASVRPDCVSGRVMVVIL